MAQFDLYPNPDSQSRLLIPWLLDVQSDLLEDSDTRVVIPLTASSRFTLTVSRLNPVFEIDGEPCVLLPLQLVGMRAQLLKNPQGNLADHRDSIIAAIDFMISGF